MTDVEIVSALALGLSYFHLKYVQIKSKKRNIRQKRRLWMNKIHSNRTRQFMENKFYELLNEPSGECNNFCSMSITDFEYLLCKIAPKIDKQDTDFREAIPTKYRLAITLRYLASGDSFRTLHNMFKVSPPTISKIVREVCRALNEVLHEEIRMPETARGWKKIETGFKNQFPHCIGCLDNKQILIEDPSRIRSNHNKWLLNIVLVTLIDSEYKFIFADTGFQEEISDGGVYNNSKLSQKISSNEIKFPPPKSLSGSDFKLPYVFLADGTFALNTHVMIPYIPYPGIQKIGTDKMSFNKSLNRSRVVVENTFGILTSAFRIFRRPINLNAQIVLELVMTCVLLHNFLRNSENSVNIYSPDGSFDVYDSFGNLETPGLWRRHGNEYSSLANLPWVPQVSPTCARQIRDEFATYFFNNE